MKRWPNIGVPLPRRMQAQDQSASASGDEEDFSDSVDADGEYLQTIVTMVPILLAPLSLVSFSLSRQCREEEKPHNHQTSKYEGGKRQK